MPLSLCACVRLLMGNPAHSLSLFMLPVFEEYQEFIPDFDSFLECHAKPLPNHFRVNRLKIAPDSLIRMLQSKGIWIGETRLGEESFCEAPGSLSIGKLIEYFLGYLHPQAFTSCLASLILAPRPNSYVLDLCAAPGGKTAHMAQGMNNTGLIIANELHQRRHAPLVHTLSRLGVMNAMVTQYPAQEFPMRERFDFIMADVPCSGEGRWRPLGETHPKEGGRARARMVDLQKRMILRAFDLLRIDGVLLYSTCTYSPEENEGVLDFLLRNREAEILPIGDVPGVAPGVSEWKEEKYDGKVRKAGRFYPHRIDSVGFFVARIGRRS